MNIAMNVTTNPTAHPAIFAATVAKSVHRLKVMRDDDPTNPRTDWDCNLGTMYCKHRSYTLGDEDAQDISEYNYKTEQRETPTKGYTILPLYLYDHSGITMNTTGFHCPWDSGCVGYIYLSDEKARKEYGWKNITKKRREQLTAYLKAEVETYDQYLTGDVYGFIYEEVLVNEETGEEDVIYEDSCWGFFGSDLESNGIKDHLLVDLKDCEITWE